MEKRMIDFVGPISDVPLRKIDLVPAFYEVLFKYWPEKAEQLEEIYMMATRDDYDDNPDLEGWWACEIQELIDVLNEIAPEGYYFGVPPGEPEVPHDAMKWVSNDTYNYGFWPVE